LLKFNFIDSMPIVCDDGAVKMRIPVGSFGGTLGRNDNLGRRLFRRIVQQAKDCPLIPGNPRELSMYPAGLPSYLEACEKSIAEGLSGFQRA
jgi:hypothetical protein